MKGRGELDSGTEESRRGEEIDSMSGWRVFGRTMDETGKGRGFLDRIARWFGRLRGCEFDGMRFDGRRSGREGGILERE